MDPNIPIQPPAPVQPSFPAEPVQPTSQMPPVEPAPVAPPPPAKKTNWVLILGIILLLVSVLALVGYYLYQNNQLRINVPTPTPIALSSPSPVTTPDPTADWKTYTNTKYGFSFKYPSAWKEITDSETIKQGNREFRLQTNNGEFVNGIVFDKFDTSLTEQIWSKQIKLNSGKAVLITYTDNLGPGSKGGEKDIEIFNQILSTFQFTNAQSTPSATPTATPI